MHKALKCDNDKRKNKFKPLDHQVRVTKEFLSTNKRGLLFWHQLGSGKTCACYMAVDAYRKEKVKSKVYIFAPASLAGTHRNQYCDICGENPKDFYSDFRFFSYNDRVGIHKKMAKTEFEKGSIVIVDEVQDLLNGKANKSGSLVSVYDKIYKAKNIKVILLSATPIYNEHCLALLLNLLEPGIVTMDKDEFTKKCKDENYLFSRLKGLVSYVPVPDKSLYPRRISPDIMYKVEMSPHQFESYDTIRQSELDQFKITDDQIQKAIRQGDLKKARSLKARKFILSSMIRSRLLCNFSYPVSISENKNYKSDLNANWILNDDSDEHIKNLKQYSPKMAKLIYNLLTLPGKHMVYSWAISKYGINLIYTLLKHCGIEPLVFSGNESLNTREKNLKAFNDPDNKRGEKHKIILVSSAGTTGISLFCIKHLHIFEAALNEFINIQAEGRAFRTMSHHQLPEAEREVQVYRYITILPKDNTGLSSEEITYNQGMKKLEVVNKIMDIVKRISFDCEEPYNHEIKNCYKESEKVTFDDKVFNINDAFDEDNFDDLVEDI